MDKFPLCWRGKSCGEVITEQEPLYLRFSVRGSLPEAGLWCAWAIGERGELRLGILEPCGEEAFLCRRFSQRLTAPLGRMLRGELRPVTKTVQEGWSLLRENPFQTPWLRKQLQHISGAMICTEHEVRYLALPYEPKQPFPLVPLFCFAKVREIQGRQYAVFAFDREEFPSFP